MLYIAEGETFGYTVQLTHKPGVREDETVDLMNDEVRIYLTSSQEVYQQDDDSGGGTDFQQRVGHRTQLTIDTNVATNGATLDASGKMSGSKTARASYTGPAAYAAGRAAVPGADDEHHEGPTPYYYVAYSTVNPSQASPTDDGSGGAGTSHFSVVCPVCTHEAYCTQTTTIIAGTVVCADPLADPYADASTTPCTTLLATGAATDQTQSFEGCYDIVYNGFAPIYDDCSENAAVARARAAETTPVVVTPVYVGYNILAADEATGAGAFASAAGWEGGTATEPTAMLKKGEKSSNEGPTATTGGYNYYPYGEPNGPAPGIPYGDQTMKAHSCRPKVSGFNGEGDVDGQIIQRVPMGGEDPSWLTHEECWDKIAGVWSDCAGNLEAVPASCSTDSCEPVAADPVPGASDYRIRADGSPVLRDIPRIDDYCRYCDRPGLFCDVDRKPSAADSDADLATWNPLYGADTSADYLTTESPFAAGTGLPNAANTLRGRECIKDTVNGGDTAPNSANWKYTSYTSGPSWRGDLSSGAQLVFDSTDWNVPQTVLVTARQDNVYEPEVFGRGQDAYVHHYVVAQDINLQHTYYEDIDVNDVVFTVTDDDPALVLQHADEIVPIEGQDSTNAPDLKLRLASEPMYDVTVYVQSGAFLDASGNFLPDDEQVIFQDIGQWNVCFDEESGLRSVTDTAATDNSVGGSQANNCNMDGTVESDSTEATFNPSGSGEAGTFEDHGYAGRFKLHACDISGQFVRPESYKDGGEAPTAGYELPTGWKCTSYSTEAECTGAKPSEGCAWEDADNVWVPCVCTGYDDHPTGGSAAGTFGEGSDGNAYDGFMSGTSHAGSGTKYPVCHAATAGDAGGASPDACQNVEGVADGAQTGIKWIAASGCIDLSTGAPAERLNDGYGTDRAGDGETPALTEEQCMKTGLVHGSTGFCKTAQGTLLPALTTEAACIGSGSSGGTPGDMVELAGANGNPTTRGSCVEALQVNSVACSGTDQAACNLEKQCEFVGGNCVDRTNWNAASKSMDLVCATLATSGACVKEGCTWDAAAGGSGLCKAEKLGYDCNSYLTFTSTNWNSWQTLKVIAVDDDEDETVARPAGFDISDIGYLISSRDWYYNSAGSKEMETKSTQTASLPATWSPGTPQLDVSRYTPANFQFSMFDTRFGVHINRYPWPSSGDSETPGGVADCDDNSAGSGVPAQAQLATDSEIMSSPQNGNKIVNGANAQLDATPGRYGTGNRFVHNENGMSAWIDPNLRVVEATKLYGVSTAGGHVDAPVGYTSEPKHSCLLKAPHPNVDANNEVCLDGDGGSAVDGPASMVTTFASPSSLGATCGATSKVTDVNIRQVTISRGFCQATEGRRFFYKDFMHQKNPTTAEQTFHVLGQQRDEKPSKLVTTLGQMKNAAADIDNFPVYLAATAVAAEPGDMWSSAYARPDVVETLGTHLMTMPTCPFTIKLETAPLEGATVVVEVFEDPELVAMRDSELYFYEEPTFRPGVTSQTECETHFPGSLWIAGHDGGSCFIQNVPYTAQSGTAYQGLGFAPRGGTSIDVMFTDADWDVPRRITAIALNDDVDEPDEYRGIFFDTKPCTGNNHNPSTVLPTSSTGAAPVPLACVEDPLYNDAVITTDPTGDGVTLTGQDAGPKDSITVQVIDDDIADLVVLCNDNEAAFVDECTKADGSLPTEAECTGLAGCTWSAQAPAGGAAAGAVGAGRCIQDFEDDEAFIGSYDDSHPHNRWDEGVERRGANAEDGMSYSEFGGGLSTLTDGITGAAGDAACDNCGYVSVAGSPTAVCASRTTLAGTLNTLDQSETWAQDLEEGCYPDTAGNGGTGGNGGSGTVTGYDPYTDKYCITNAPTADIADTYASGAWSHTGSHCTNYVTVANHPRGFKGAGPAFTEATDNYACTIHSNECHVGTDGSSLKNSEGAACDYGKFKVRLNSSPGVKKVKRQYTGSTVAAVEEELVYIVVTPDETPQTRFEPTSVTFTDTGGLVNGVLTQRWDEPLEISVVPKDDQVDERMGVIVDFTAFSITQSHAFDEYWKYTVPYMTLDAPTYPFTGVPCVPAYSAVAGYSFSDCEGGKNSQSEAQYVAGGFTGVIDGHTPYRHTIRTIHTKDNDYSGVRIEGSTAQTLNANANQYTHNVLAAGNALTAEEGGTFAWYSLQLDTRPYKVQRQSGTDPNKVLDHDEACGDVCADEPCVTNAFKVGDFFADYTDRTRPSDGCGSVEPASEYWVDVTVTQTIHMDLATPASCPASAGDAPWGGGAVPPTAAHPRFPFNANAGAPFDELVDRPGDMDTYLTTCGGWQRDATYRFTADNWNIPQYVYVYAHNDKDAANAASGANDVDHVMRGGNELFDEGQTYYTTTLKHYVETEDTLDNSLADKDKFVQWNKHGGIYTYGNIERFPFGYDRDSRLAATQSWGCPTDKMLNGQTWAASYATEALADTACGTANSYVNTLTYGKLDETGYTTWGYSKYESLYGYGYFKNGEWSTEGCCSTAMGGAWGAYTAGISTWGTSDGFTPARSLGGTDVNADGAEFRTVRTDLSDSPPAATSRYTCSFARRGSNDDGSGGASDVLDGEVQVGPPCVEAVTALGEPRPYDATGQFCTPTVEIGAVAGAVGAASFAFCIPRFATSYQTFNDRDGDQTDRTTGVAMKFPPADVEVRVSDNDIIADQTAAVSSCKQSQFVMWSDAESPLTTDSTGVDLARSEWLLDYNCAPTVESCTSIVGTTVTGADTTNCALTAASGGALGSCAPSTAGVSAGATCDYVAPGAGDAGGLPGYPVGASNGAAGIDPSGR